MGRSKKNKKRGASSSHPNPNQNKSQNWKKKPRKGKWQRFWVEDCPDTVIIPDREYSLQVVISRVELTDDYTQQQSVVAASIPQSRLPRSNCVANNYDEKLPETDTIICTQYNHECATEEHQNKPGKIETSENKVIDNSKNKINKLIDGKCPQSAEVLDQKSVRACVENGAYEFKLGSLKSDASSAAQSEQKDSAAIQQASSDVATKLYVSIKRAESAKGKLEKVRDENLITIGLKTLLRLSTNIVYWRETKQFFDNDNFVPSANGDCGDGIKNPHPTSEVPDKFWSQRHRLFTLFDDGIQLDAESWFSVTPQAIADHIASRMAAMKKMKLVVLDPFCGCGGNVIAFAKRDEVSLVVGVDTDLGKLQKAATNARIYGIPTEKLLFIHDDACKVMSSYTDGKFVSSDDDERAKAESRCAKGDYRIGGLDMLPTMIDAIFLSPPWGGVDYVKVGKRNYGLSSIKLNGNVNGDQLLALASKALGNRPLLLFLPRNTNGSYLGQSFLKIGCHGVIEMEQNVLNGKLKTITVYAGFNSETPGPAAEI